MCADVIYLKINSIDFFCLWHELSLAQTLLIILRINDLSSGYNLVLVLSGCGTYTGDVYVLKFQCISWASQVFSEEWHFDCNGDALQT